MRTSLILCSFLLAGAAPAAELRYTGMCDASAGVALSDELFVVASDEDNVLRTYRRDTGGAAVSEESLDAFLGVDEEADIEACARVGNRVYWLTSHGRNKKGKPRPARQRFFATELAGTPAKPSLKAAGTAHRGLLAAMLSDPALAPMKLPAAEPLAPEAPGGLNIEALSPGPDGSLWIGFRNPLAGARAWLVPLVNPAELVQGKAPRFGAPVRLDLGGRGVRSMERLADGRTLIVAGPIADDGTFALYTWSGREADPPQPVAQELGTLRPEGIVTFPDGGLLLLSDDGGVTSGGRECKDLPAGARSFRALGIAMPH